MLDPSRLDACFALVLGFAFAGLCCSAYEALARRRVGLGLLQTGDLRALLRVPVVVFAAPLVIVRSFLPFAGGARQPFGAVLASTIVAAAWSLASGRLLLDLTVAALRA